MKEIMAFIRSNKVKETRDALALNGFNSYTCRKCLGRGKNRPSSVSENIVLAGSDGSRLMAKRFFQIVVADEDVKRAVQIIIEANRTNTAGDGKIFVRNVDETYCVRTGALNDLET